ncbi:MAG: 4Fe-4S binding protein [Syntrophomonadaceae bacterium]|nr:4Fe-4S binding protein [Syntrophomonadaceae bacterium]
MQIAIASGKGGTGKTLLSTCIIKVLAERNAVLIDADVEEPNAALAFMQPISATTTVHRLVPQILPDYCTFCGLCAEICKFNALVVLENKVMVFPELCHSCGACSYLCPYAAIDETIHPIGVIEKAQLPGCGTLLAGRLNIGEAQSPPLIKAAKNKAPSANVRLVDCPPGTTCTMIEAIRGSDYCMLVTEPTPFGTHDLELSLEAVKMLGMPGGMVINRWQGDDGDLLDLSANWDFPILARIPFSAELARAYMQGMDPLLAMPALRGIIADILHHIREVSS